MPLISYISVPQLNPWDGRVLRYDRYAIAEIGKKCSIIEAAKREASSSPPLPSSSPPMASEGRLSPVDSQLTASWRSYLARFFGAPDTAAVTAERT
jgi:hypothetical protein